MGFCWGGVGGKRRVIGECPGTIMGSKFPGLRGPFDRLRNHLSHRKPPQQPDSRGFFYLSSENPPFRDGAKVFGNQNPNVFWCRGKLAHLGVSSNSAFWPRPAPKGGVSARSFEVKYSLVGVNMVINFLGFEGLSHRKHFFKAWSILECTKNQL